MAGATETRRSPPFLTEDSALQLRLVCAKPLTLRGDGVDASKLLPDDAAEIAVEATIDWDGLRAATEARGPYRVVAQSVCSATRWSRVSLSEDRPAGAGGVEVLKFDVQVPRAEVYGSVESHVVVLVAEDQNSETRIAHREGSIICRQSFRIRVDKGGFEFPTRWVSFRLLGYPPDALWTLRILGDDWTGMPEDVVLLQLNEDFAGFKKLLDLPTKQDRRSSDLVRQLIVCDAIAELVLRFLNSDVRDVDPAGQRLGDVVARMIERRLSEDIDDLRKAARSDPGKIRMLVQEVVRLGDLVG